MGRSEAGVSRQPSDDLWWLRRDETRERRKDDLCSQQRKPGQRLPEPMIRNDPTSINEGAPRRRPTFNLLSRSRPYSLQLPGASEAWARGIRGLWWGCRSDGALESKSLVISVWPIRQPGGERVSSLGLEYPFLLPEQL